MSCGIGTLEDGAVLLVEGTVQHWRPGFIMDPIGKPPVIQIPYLASYCDGGGANENMAGKVLLGLSVCRQCPQELLQAIGAPDLRGTLCFVLRL